MKKRKTLKGFTLIEMVIVVALFGLIMAVVLGMLDPVKKVYNNAYLESDLQSISENMRRYIGDQVQYSDRMALYTNMSLDGTAGQENSVEYQVKKFRDRYCFTPQNVTVNQANISGTYTKERIYPYSKFKGNDEVFVLHISNPAPGLVAGGTPVALTSKLGTITLITYKNGAEVGRRVWSENTDYYDTYAFDISLQTLAEVDSTDKDGNPIKETKLVDLDAIASGGKVSPTNISMGIKMYRKDIIKPARTSANLVDSNLQRTISFKLKNLVNSTNAISDEVIEFTDKTNFPAEERVRRFAWYDNTKISSGAEAVNGATESGDIYFIFTKAPVIEKVIK